MNDKKVCIVIPVYNSQKYIKRCINSILRQSVDWWIVVAVDDGSIDNSGKILDEYSKLDSRINTIHQDNQGSIAARRNGVQSIKAQNSEYLMFVDADDELPPNAVEMLLNNHIKI